MKNKLKFHASRSQDKIVDSIDAVSTMESPQLKDGCSLIYRFEGTDTENESYSRSQLKNHLNMTPISVIQEYKSPKFQSSRLVAEQEKIIELQEKFIVNLQGEIELLEKDKKKKKSKDSDCVNILKAETAKLEEKICSIKLAYTKDLKSSKKILNEQEELIKVMKRDHETLLKSKDLKIEKLQSHLKKLKEGSLDLDKRIQELDKMKIDFSIERQEKVRLQEENSRLTDELKEITEENKLLVYNYKEVKEQYFELEKKYKNLKLLNEKTTNTQYELTSLLTEFELINKQNQILNEKLKLQSEKMILLESENNDFKLALVKARNSIQNMKEKMRFCESIKNKTVNVRELKELDFQLDLSLESLELTSSQIKTDLKSAKNLNKKLKNKEKELNEQLVRAERGKVLKNSLNVDLIHSKMTKTRPLV